ncbi:hypothetical protein N7524_010899 [Penicillium chrysogenum]|nr:hypothetical protein N7524_010899 [Penicillium chrysogenum]
MSLKKHPIGDSLNSFRAIFTSIYKGADLRSLGEAIDRLKREGEPFRSFLPPIFYRLIREESFRVTYFDLYLLSRYYSGIYAAPSNDCLLNLGSTVERKLDIGFILVPRELESNSTADTASKLADYRDRAERLARTPRPREIDNTGTLLYRSKRDEEGELIKEATERGVVNVVWYYYYTTVRTRGKTDNIRDNVRGGLDIRTLSNYRLERLSLSTSISVTVTL